MIIKTKMRLSCNSIALIDSLVKLAQTIHRNTYIRKRAFFLDTMYSYGLHYRWTYE